MYTHVSTLMGACVLDPPPHRSEWKQGAPQQGSLAAPDYIDAIPGGVGVGGIFFFFFFPTELFRTSVCHPFVVRGWGEAALLAVWQTLVPSAVFGETNTSLGKRPQCLL